MIRTSVTGLLTELVVEAVGRRGAVLLISSMYIFSADAESFAVESGRAKLEEEAPEA